MSKRLNLVIPDSACDIWEAAFGHNTDSDTVVGRILVCSRSDNESDVLLIECHDMQKFELIVQRMNDDDFSTNLYVTHNISKREIQVVLAELSETGFLSEISEEHRNTLFSILTEIDPENDACVYERRTNNNYSIHNRRSSDNEQLRKPGPPRNMERSSVERRFAD